MIIADSKCKRFSLLKIVFISMSVAAIVSATVTVFLIFLKKRNESEKRIENEIEAAINAAFCDESD